MRLLKFEAKMTSLERRELNQGFPYFIVGIVILGWISISFPRMIFPPILPLIENAYNISHAQAGLLMSAYMLPYASMQIPTGFLIQRFGKKRFMVASVFGAAIPAFLMSFASTFEHVLLLRFIQGFLSGMWYSSSTTLVTDITEERSRGKGVGLSMIGGPISMTAINLIVGLISFSDWRTYLLLSAPPGIICGLLIIFRVGEENIGDTKRESMGRSSFIKAIKIPMISLTLFFSFITALAGWGLMTFVPTYLVSEKGALVSEASLMLIFNSAASAFAGPLGGFLTDKFSYWLPTIVSITAMCSVSYFLPILPLGMGTAAIFGVWGAMGGMSGTSLILLISHIVPSKIRGAILGANNTMGFISATIGPVIFGYVADVLGFTFFFRLALILNLAGLIMLLLMMKLRHNIEAYRKSL